MLVQKDSRVLLATTDADAVVNQEAVDQEIVNSTAFSPEQCAEINFSENDLKEGMRTAIMTNEDVGRYV